MISQTRCGDLRPIVATMSTRAVREPIATTIVRKNAVVVVGVPLSHEPRTQAGSAYSFSPTARRQWSICSARMVLASNCMTNDRIAARCSLEGKSLR